MSGVPVKQFNLPWHQHERYRIALYPVSGEFSPAVQQALIKEGASALPNRGFSVIAPRNWKERWDRLAVVLHAQGIVDQTQAEIIPENETAAIANARRSATAYTAIADSLWLGDALLDGRIMCYLQPVVSNADKVFGYESFVRARAVDGAIIAGDKIVAASKALGIEYAIDRHLHVQAIKTFISSEFNGFLFVNFFPGFIHRPAVYLEGLSETVKSYGIVAKHIVLDFTQSETARDSGHIRTVCEYGRSRGYSIAFDDILSVEGAKKLLPDIRPDFVKLDMRLVHHCDSPSVRSTIQHIVELAHAYGGMVIAEGVESEAMYQTLRQLGADLFQGYLFSPPMPVDTVLRKSHGT